MIFWFKSKIGKSRMPEFSEDKLLNKIERECSWRNRSEIESHFNKYAKEEKLQLLVQISDFIDFCLKCKYERAKISHFLHNFARSSMYLSAEQLSNILKIFLEMITKRIEPEKLLLTFSKNAPQLKLLHFDHFLFLAEEMLKKNIDPTITINYLFELHPQLLQENSQPIFSLLIKLVEKQIDPKETVWALGLLPRTMPSEDFITLLTFLINLVDQNENPHVILTTIINDPKQAMLYDPLKTIDWKKLALHDAEVKKSKQLLEVIVKKLYEGRWHYASTDDGIWDIGPRESLQNIQRYSAEDFNKIAPMILELLKNGIFPNDFILMAESLIRLYPNKLIEYLNILKEIMLRRVRCRIDRRDAFSTSIQVKKSRFRNYFFYKLNQKLLNETDKFDLYISQILNDLTYAEERAQKEKQIEIEYKKWLKTLNEKSRDMKVMFRKIEGICKYIRAKAYDKDLLSWPIKYSHVQKLEKYIEGFIQSCNVLSSDEFVAVIERLSRTRFQNAVFMISSILSEDFRDEEQMQQVAFLLADTLANKGCAEEASYFLENLGLQLFASKNFGSAHLVFEKAKSILEKTDHLYDKKGNDVKKELFGYFDELSKASELCPANGCSLSKLGVLAESGDELTRIIAMRAICLVFDWDSSSEVLIKLLKDPSARVRRMTTGAIFLFMYNRIKLKSNIYVFFESGFHKKLANAIFLNINDEDPTVREVVIESLGLIGDESFIPALIERKGRENKEMQVLIENAISRIETFQQDLRKWREWLSWREWRKRRDLLETTTAIRHGPGRSFHDDYIVQRIKEKAWERQREWWERQGRRY